MRQPLLLTIKQIIWRMIYSPIYSLRYLCAWRERKALNILNSEQTCRYIIENRCSVSRFGDGEFQLIGHWLANGRKENFHVDSFQEYDADLARRLFEVLNISTQENLLICLPFPFKKASVYSGYSRLFFKREFLSRRNLMEKMFSEHTLCGDSCFTRFYLNRRDIKSFSDYIEELKSIWCGRDVLLVEGRYSRLGVGNDLFCCTRSLRRIECPAVGAFSKYDEIVSSVKNNVKVGTLVLLALGQTATVLACDLSRHGIQAIDIGHIDIEYEWYLMKAKEKVPVKNKYVNEVQIGRIMNGINDSKYIGEVILDLSQI